MLRTGRDMVHYKFADQVVEHIAAQCGKAVDEDKVAAALRFRKIEVGKGGRRKVAENLREIHLP